MADQTDVIPRTPFIVGVVGLLLALRSVIYTWYNGGFIAVSWDQWLTATAFTGWVLYAVVVHTTLAVARVLISIYRRFAEDAGL